MAHSWKNYLGVLSVAVHAAISGLPVSAAADDLRTCSTDQGAVATATCTAAITSGTLHGHDLAVAYLNRGLLQEKQGQHSDAVSDLNEAIRLDPNFAAAFLDRGVAYQNMGQYELAVQDYNRTIALNPNSATAYFNSGLVYSFMRHYDAAILAYDQAIRLIQGMRSPLTIDATFSQCRARSTTLFGTAIKPLDSIRDT